jgi:hypothetical protein
MINYYKKVEIKKYNKMTYSENSNYFILKRPKKLIEPRRFKPNINLPVFSKTPPPPKNVCPTRPNPKNIGVFTGKNKTGLRCRPLDRSMEINKFFHHDFSGLLKFSLSNCQRKIGWCVARF